MKASTIATSLALVAPCWASIGLTGIDSWPNSPFCATACYGCLSSYRLDCSEIHGDPDDHDAHVVTSPECRADDVHWLTSLAWCISTKCEEVQEGLSTGDIEKFWEEKALGDGSVEPMWTYSQSLANVTEEPSMVLGHGGTINETVVPPEFWFVLYGTYKTLDGEGWNMNVFGYVSASTFHVDDTLTPYPQSDPTQRWIWPPDRIVLGSLPTRCQHVIRENRTLSDLPEPLQAVSRSTFTFQPGQRSDSWSSTVHLRHGSSQHHPQRHQLQDYTCTSLVPE